MKKLLTTLAAAIGLAATTFAATVNLAQVSGNTTLNNGDVAIGTLAGNYKVSIADGATVTLAYVTINGVDDSDYSWAGITCEGDATIILEGANTVKGFYDEYPGIDVPENKTLTIKGDGSLDARSNGWGAGIGGGYEISCGNIVIEGGTITATGGYSAAGIGAGYTAACGDITITGGTITATGGSDSVGIGGGECGNCGDITISGGTISATGDEAGIGTGYDATCGDITISGGTISATGIDDSAAGIGSGNCGECGNITITKGVTSVTATKGAYAPNSIGAGQDGTCGTVTIGGVVGAITESPYTFYGEKIDLSALTGNITVPNGSILTGTLGGNYKVSIADGATVTLRDVTINGVDDIDYSWAGITCEGDATIILEGANTVKGFCWSYPGVYVPENKTLTIRGSGSLDASSNGYGAGIGGGSGGECGNITISGGYVTATGGTCAAGIGGGYMATCGDITITKGVSIVTATKGEYAPNSIGAGYAGTCGMVTVGGVVTGNITESPYMYYGQVVDLSGLSGAYTAQDGDTLKGTTAYAVTIPAGATVTVNGVSITGAAGGTVLPSPAFSAGGKAATTEFTQGANGKWTLTAFAELGNDALGADVANGQIKVYRADTPQGLDSASPMASGVEVKAKKSAVMTTIEVTPPSGAQSQFFKVKFGE